ncbi:MAG: DmsC/YnfH family molybdoenzyme membrane anchor subunit [Nitrospiria bacterium]
MMEDGERDDGRSFLQLAEASEGAEPNGQGASPAEGSSCRQVPEYMFLEKPERNLEKSRHGTSIRLDQTYPDLAGKPLDVNGDHRVFDNPDRYKQHGFHFHADNCIACHACESACSEKNNLPPHLAFRTVGSIEGGTYPAVTRINISMACNHCEDPVCLKGCPTRAYTKFLEYGAVLQDPDICFGCGYCTWVCPYNAPQLDPVKGQVEKCNMCVDRLEVGLKPACVTACLGNALEFGVIEEIPAGRQEAALKIPGFPDPAISRPNIRFQQTRSLPDTFTHVDAEPIRYQGSRNGEKQFTVQPLNQKEPAGWGLNQLRSREDPLVLFTLTSQFVVGAFLLLFLTPLMNGSTGSVPTRAEHPLALAASLLGLVILQTAGLVSSTLHLGKPQYFYRAMNNLRHSWVSREIAAMGAFYHLFSAYALVTIFPALVGWLPETFSVAIPPLLGWGAVVMGPLGLYCMYRCYRIKARPFWDHWHSGGVFFASALILGSAGVGLVFGLAEFVAGRPPAPFLSWMAIPLLGGLILQAVSSYAHLRHLKHRGEEAAVSHALMVGRYGKTSAARRISWGILMAMGLIFALSVLEGGWALAGWGGMLALALVHEIVGRALFYVLVVPTTIPGGSSGRTDPLRRMHRRAAWPISPRSA